MRLLKKVLVGVVALAVLAFPFIVWDNAQALTDWWALHSYKPSSTLSSIANQDMMTAYARHVFYVNHPQLQISVDQFRSDCGQNEKTIILGCYHSNQDGIFIYKVQDPRLAGILQVTAAHEMLHAAYDRLDANKKAQLNSWLQAYYDSGLEDQRIKTTIDAYHHSEPKEVINEMHSIFGTEVANLPAPLENYYKQYFSNRASVVAFAQAYQNEFTSRESQITSDDSRLVQLKSRINDEENSLQTQLVKINNDRAQLDALRSSGRIQEYNSGVADFNGEVSAYNLQVESLKADISTYNDLVAERNSIAEQLASLDKAIDTRPLPKLAQ